MPSPVTGRQCRAASLDTFDNLVSNGAVRCEYHSETVDTQQMPAHTATPGFIGSACEQRGPTL